MTKVLQVKKDVFEKSIWEGWLVGGAYYYYYCYYYYYYHYDDYGAPLPFARASLEELRFDCVSWNLF